MEIYFPDENIENLRAKLLVWFAQNGRHDIPWKLNAFGHKPANGEILCVYHIWVAEVMLQQTQLQVALPYWERWIMNFPTLLDVAKADLQDILRLWQGLGYYSRARRLHKSSKILLDLIGLSASGNPTSWPRQLEIWLTLPGIGRSTAGSILSSAFDIPAPILDGNVKRVLARLSACPIPPIKNMTGFWALSEQLLDRSAPRSFNQALMDLGSIVCTPRNPNCCCCPWKEHCIAYSSQTTTKFPVKVAKKTMSLEAIGVGLVFNDLGEVLIDQRLNDGLLGGLWEFPGGKQEKGETIELTISRELREELGIEVEVCNQLIALDHSYSHRKLHISVYFCKLTSGEPQALASQEIRWVHPSKLSQYPFPAANSKIIEALLLHLGLSNLNESSLIE